MIKIAIIGAGLSGLSAAHFLKDHVEITLFEKACSVSGRISTRYAGPYFFDYGAQYFTVRTRIFHDFIQPLISQGIIERWSPRYVKFDSDKIIERKNWRDDEPRYVGVPGMNNIAKYMAEGLNINVNTRIVSLQSGDAWQLIDESGQLYRDFDWVISTAPSPQTAKILTKKFKFYDDIKNVEMRACISLMLGFSENLSLEFEAAHVINSDLSWIAVNSHKPRRTDQFTLIVHSSAKYSEKHLEDDRKTIMQHLINEAGHVIGHDVNIADYKTIHCWRYANNAKRENCHILLDPELKLAACGDWCLGGRVEGAFVSAYNLVNFMKESVL